MPAGGCVEEGLSGTLNVRQLVLSVANTLLFTPHRPYYINDYIYIYIYCIYINTSMYLYLEIYRYISLDIYATRLIYANLRSSIDTFVKERNQMGHFMDDGTMWGTLRPASLLWRFMAARASCPVSNASTNCLEMASPKPTLSLHPPHSHPWPPGKLNQSMGERDVWIRSHHIPGRSLWRENPIHVRVPFAWFLPMDFFYFKVLFKLGWR